MKNFIKIANFFAERSTLRYTKLRPLRVLNRMIYREMGNFYLKFSKTYHERLSWYYGYDFDKDHHVKISDNISIRNPDHGINTYPLPYADESFAPEPDADDYLVGDFWGFVRRHSTSYVAYKVFELIGKALVQRSYFRKNKIYHAKDWAELLTLNGLKRVDAPQTGGHYVAVLPNDGEYGNVSWYEDTRKIRQNNTIVYEVSTYRHGHHSIEYIPHDNPGVTWFEIC